MYASVKISEVSQYRKQSHYLHILESPKKILILHQKNLIVPLNHPYIMLQKINLIILTLKLT